MKSPVTAPQIEQKVPAETTVAPSVAKALHFARQDTGNTYSGQIRHVLTVWAKANPAPVSFELPAKE